MTLSYQTRMLCQSLTPLEAHPFRPTRSSIISSTTFNYWNWLTRTIRWRFLWNLQLFRWILALLSIKMCNWMCEICFYTWIISDTRARWECRVNLYTDIDLLILTHVLEPSFRLNEQRVFDSILSFSTSSCTSIMHSIESDRPASIVLKEEFCLWILADVS